MLEEGGGALWVDGKAVEEATESGLRNSPKRSGLEQGWASELDDSRSWSNGSTRKQREGRDKHYTLACILGALLSGLYFPQNMHSDHSAAHLGIHGPPNAPLLRTLPWTRHHP